MFRVRVNQVDKLVSIKAKPFNQPYGENNNKRRPSLYFTLGPLTYALDTFSPKIQKSNYYVRVLEIGVDGEVKHVLPTKILKPMLLYFIMAA